MIFNYFALKLSSKISKLLKISRIMKNAIGVAAIAVTNALLTMFQNKLAKFEIFHYLIILEIISFLRLMLRMSELIYI